MENIQIDSSCIQAVDFCPRSVSHLWISAVHLWPHSKPRHWFPPRALTFAPPWRTMMWTWMRKRREKYSGRKPGRAIGGRTVEMMAAVTHRTRDEEEAAWWTAAVGPRSSRKSLHHGQRTVTVEGEPEPDCPASVWVIVCLSFCLGHTSSEFLPLNLFNLFPLNVLCLRGKYPHSY